MIGNTYINVKLLKRKIPFKARYRHYKGTRKVKDFQKLSNKEIYFTLQLIVLNNTTDLSNSFHG